MLCNASNVACVKTAGNDFGENILITEEMISTVTNYPQVGIIWTYHRWKGTSTKEVNEFLFEYLSKTTISVHLKCHF